MPLQAKTVYPQCTLTKKSDSSSTTYSLELHNRPDNRLTPEFIQKSILPCLDDVEADWRESSKNGNGAASLITYGPRDADRFYSNGLDLMKAFETPLFFPKILNVLLARFLTFPIPTIAALNGHAFAGGFCLALAHDFRIVKNAEGKKQIWLCFNEIDFGANLPLGMMAVIKAKISDPSTIRKVALVGQRIGAPEALKLGIVDDLGSDGDEVVNKATALGQSLSGKAKAHAWGLIKSGLYSDAIRDLALDRGNDGTGPSVAAKL